MVLNQAPMRVDLLDLNEEDIVPAHKASPVRLSAEHECEPSNPVRAHSTPQKLAERSRISAGGDRAGDCRNG
jgi:hypothetical protein